MGTCKGSDAKPIEAVFAEEDTIATIKNHVAEKVLGVKGGEKRAATVQEMQIIAHTRATRHTSSMSPPLSLMKIEEDGGGGFSYNNFLASLNIEGGKDAKWLREDFFNHEVPHLGDLKLLTKSEIFDACKSRIRTNRIWEAVRKQVERAEKPREERDAGGHLATVYGRWKHPILHEPCDDSSLLANECFAPGTILHVISTAPTSIRVINSRKRMLGSVTVCANARGQELYRKVRRLLAPSYGSILLLNHDRKVIDPWGYIYDYGIGENQSKVVEVNRDNAVIPSTNRLGHPWLRPE